MSLMELLELNEGFVVSYLHSNGVDEDDGEGVLTYETSEDGDVQTIRAGDLKIKMHHFKYEGDGVFEGKPGVRQSVYLDFPNSTT